MSVLVGKQAPDFTVPAVLGNGEIVDSFSFSAATQGKYAVVVFYPLDFTFVPDKPPLVHHILHRNLEQLYAPYQLPSYNAPGQYHPH
jgi:hypothetical protein